MPPKEMPTNLTACAREHRAKSLWMLDVLPEDVLMAQGYRDQFVIVSPKSKYVLVRLGHGWEHKRRSDFLRSVARLLQA